MDEKIFKCPNHMNVTIKKDGGELVLDESCCTAMVILLKNDGNMATSFYGYHNEKIIKVMNNAQKKYFKSLKKRLKTESEEDTLTIVPNDIPEDKKWDEKKELPKCDKKEDGHKGTNNLQEKNNLNKTQKNCKNKSSSCVCKKGKVNSKSSTSVKK